MKNKIAIIACLAACLTVAATKIIPKHEVIILRVQPYGYNSQAGYQYLGQRVYNSSVSSNAPAFPNQLVGWDLPHYAETQAAEYLARALDDDYKIVSILPDGNGGTQYVLQK